jgi:hypothetical protein
VDIPISFSNTSRFNIQKDWGVLNIPSIPPDEISCYVRFKIFGKHGSTYDTVEMYIGSPLYGLEPMSHVVVNGKVPASQLWDELIQRYYDGYKW